MRLMLLTLLLIVGPSSLFAQTLTTRDIVSLNKSGLGEEVLLALIEVHRSVFPVDADTLRMLKVEGVPQKVIAAMVKSGRDVPIVEPVVDPEPAIGRQLPVSPQSVVTPQVVVIDHQDSRAREVAVPVAVPVYVPVRVRPSHPVQPVRPVEPVFWGFGGKLRPDAWKPVETHHKPFFLVEGPQKK